MINCPPPLILVGQIYYVDNDTHINYNAGCYVKFHTVKFHFMETIHENSDLTHETVGLNFMANSILVVLYISYLNKFHWKFL